MTKKFYNLPRMYTETTGSSDIEFTTAVPGCKTFEQAGFVDSDELNYGIITYDTATHRPVGTEVGLGRYLASDSDGGPYLQRTTVYSSISQDTDDTEDANITLTGLSEVYVPWLKEDILRVREADSDPSVYPVNTIIFSNSTVTDNGNGVVTVVTGGGSSDSDAGGGALQFAIYENSTIPQDTITDTSTADPMTLSAEIADASNLFTLSSDVLTCAVAGMYNVHAEIYVVDVNNFGNGYLWAYFDSTSTEPGPVNWPQCVVSTTVDSAMGELYMSLGGPIALGIGDTLWVALTNESGGTVDAAVTELLITRLGD